MYLSILSGVFATPSMIPSTYPLIRQESDDEIGQLCQDFEEMRLRLKANAEEKVAFDRENKELISNISHDLKTPIRYY